MQAQHAHLNQHQSVAYEHKASSPANVERIARAALGKIESAKPVLEKHFSKQVIPQSTFAPKKVYNQTMYMPY